ncbi:uncharacterized protein LOC121257806 [Juglans microcarpa x Juglans regia]|uniref:uncharacterized protein LOC121257806 n=1 Tax=Juglans microcarpa x Juglans regia TaxID=2249226 RepID=UPI001B7DB478|nr:uncharacterized protein LOC121257806 [Juglans microcarpa x Juglans regia]
MAPFAKSRSSLIVVMITLVFTIASFPTVGSEHHSSAIRLPSEDDGNNCAGGSMPASCPIKCFRPDPVCGVDGVTYWCGCHEALCAGVKVAKFGFCEVGNGGPGPLSGQALLLVHIVWLIVLGFSVLFGLF